MKNYHGIIVDESFKDKEELKKLKIIGSKKSGAWVLYKISFPSSSLNRVIKFIQKNMKERYYAHVYLDKRLIVIFKKKIFNITTDKASWKDAIKCGFNIGIPEKQLDFCPCRIEDETY